MLWSRGSSDLPLLARGCGKGRCPVLRTYTPGPFGESAPSTRNLYAPQTTLLAVTPPHLNVTQVACASFNKDGLAVRPI